MPLMICSGCGAWQPDKSITAVDERWATATCAACGAGERFLRLPLYVVTGASGVGKSTLARTLLHRLPDYVVLESDVLWGSMPYDEDGSYERAWLRMIAAIHQAGRSVVLFGTFVPEKLERLVERRYIGEIAMLALVADDETIAARLRSRPAWRETHHDTFVAEHIAFNGWLRREGERGDPSFIALDTTALNVEQAAQAVVAWVQSC